MLKNLIVVCLLFSLQSAFAKTMPELCADLQLIRSEINSNKPLVEIKNMLINLKNEWQDVVTLANQECLNQSSLCPKGSPAWLRRDAFRRMQYYTKLIYSTTSNSSKQEMINQLDEIQSKNIVTFTDVCS